MTFSAVVFTGETQCKFGACLHMHRFSVSFPLSVEQVTTYYANRLRTGITSLFLKLRAGVRSPVGSISWLRFFLNSKTNIKKLGLISPRVLFGHNNHPKSYSSVYERRRSLTLGTFYTNVKNAASLTLTPACKNVHLYYTLKTPRSRGR